MTEKLDIGLKNTQNKEDVEKVKEKNAKIERLDLSVEDKNKLDAIIKGIDEFKQGPAEQMAQAFLGIKEAFKFSEERVNIIKNEIIGGFAERQLEKLNLSAEQKDEILKIIMGEEEKEEEKEETEETEKRPEQELLLKAYEQLIKQKEYFLKILNGLKFDKKAVNDIFFFSDSVKEILKILGTDEKEKGFISIRAANLIVGYFNKRDEMAQELELVDDKKFIDDFERHRDEIIKLEKTWSDFSQTLVGTVNWLTEFDLLFSYFEESNPEFVEKVSEKIEPLLKHFGFEQIYPKKGEEYNPREHLVDGEIAESGVKRGQVVRVVRQGLKKGGEVIQKARVIIAK